MDWEEPYLNVIRGVRSKEDLRKCGCKACIEALRKLQGAG